MIIGIVLILLGIYFLLKFLIPGFNINLDWDVIWPIILIALGINSTVKFKKIDIFNIALVIIGILYLLLGLEVIPKVDSKITVAIILIAIGLSFVLSSVKKKNKSKKIAYNKDANYKGIFGGTKEKIDDDNFKGTSCYAVFGGVELNLKDINLKTDVVIDCYAIFGGIDIVVPENVNIVTKSSSVFGGIENKSNNKNNPKNKTIYVNATCMFGGIEIKR